jgi:hypothetical protein
VLSPVPHTYARARRERERERETEREIENVRSKKINAELLCVLVF